MISLGSSASGGAHNAGSPWSHAINNFVNLCFLHSFFLLLGGLSSCLHGHHLVFVVFSLLRLIEWIKEPVGQVNLASLSCPFLSNFLQLCGVVVLDRSLVKNSDALLFGQSLGFEDFVGLSDEVWHFVLQVPINVEQSVLFWFDPGLWEIVIVDDLFDISVCKKFEFLRAADSASERKDTTLERVMAGSRMCDSERAVYAVAVVHLRAVYASRVIPRRFPTSATNVRSVAPVTHKVGTEAVEESCGAAVLALPVNLIGTVLIACGSTCTNLFKEAVLAE